MYILNCFVCSNFAPVVGDVADLAREHMDGKHYYVLVIITDGIITDMPQTKEVTLPYHTTTFHKNVYRDEAKFL